jgi:hypothetical protein
VSVSVFQMSLSWSVISLSCAASADLVQGLIDDPAYCGVASECSDVLAVLLNEFGVLSSAGAR